MIRYSSEFAQKALSWEAGPSQATRITDAGSDLVQEVIAAESPFDFLFYCGCRDVNRLTCSKVTTAPQLVDPR